MGSRVVTTQAELDAVAVGVKVADLVVIPGSTAKAKAKAVVRACVEVDIQGNPVQS